MAGNTGGRHAVIVEVRFAALRCGRRAAPGGGTGDATAAPAAEAARAGADRVTYSGPLQRPASYHPRVNPLQPSAPDADASAPAVLDAAALQRLQALDPSGENRVVERVLRAFEGSLERMLGQASAAQASGDHATVRHVAHTLKSSSASVGALRLSQHCSEIEHRLRRDESAGVEASLHGLQSEGWRVLAAVRRMLAP